MSQILGHYCDMKINTAIIKELNPCRDRLHNYISHYRDFEGDTLAFLDLDKITPQDKMWVAFRLLPQKQVVEIACRIAESVLHLYEEQYPGDLRPRKAIEAARSGDKDAAADAAAHATHAAADAARAATHAAARAATHAAADAAHAAADAADAAHAAADATAYVAVHAAATHAAATHAAHATAYVAVHAAATHAAHIEIIKDVVKENK